MAYHDELLQQAFELAHKDPATQADLRRSVSAAYYALFQLLISETIAHWSLDSSRPALSRMFDHSLMKKASARISDARLFPFHGEDLTAVGNLRTVAHLFRQLQDSRHVADYDNSTYWTHSEALQQVTKAAEAFTAW